MKYLFIQFGNYLCNKDTPNYILKYNDLVYRKLNHLGFSGWLGMNEIPLWIPRIAHLLKSTATMNDQYGIAVIDSDNYKESINEIIDNYKPATVLFSRLVCNSKYIEVAKEIIGDRAKVIVGGYDNNDYTIDKMCDEIGIANTNGYNYDLLKDVYVIPRLQMSTGCLYNCEFCTIEKNINIIDTNDIIKNVNAFENLKFKLVYIDDKTFGQASNWKLLGLMADYIEQYNGQFTGFIVQTSPILTKDIEFCKSLANMGVKIVELGIESGSKDELIHFRKPFKIDDIYKSIDNLRLCNINIVPNIIINSPFQQDSDYKSTLDLIENIKHEILYFNIFNYADYNNNHVSVNTTIDDQNENTFKKSWIKHNISAKKVASIYDIITEQLNLLKIHEL
jgi:hypothetical protein